MMRVRYKERGVGAYLPRAIPVRVGLIPGEGVGVRHVVSVHPPLEHVEGVDSSHGRDLRADAAHGLAELQPETGTSQTGARPRVPGQRGWRRRRGFPRWVVRWVLRFKV